MRALLESLRLAFADYRREALLSLCSVCILAAVLAPLMVLLGVQHGVISAMTERLLGDPRTLEVTPVGSGVYGPAWFRELELAPGVAFALPQTRSIAATMNLRGKNGTRAALSMIATGPGDPLLARWNQPDAVWLSAGSAPVAGVILSESAARKLALNAGDNAEGLVDRIFEGRRESAALGLRVLSVLPPEAQPTDVVFVPLELLVAGEDYRDGRAVPFLGWSGGVPPGGEDAGHTLDDYAARARSEREYASFRLYARGLDEVAPLWQWFKDRKIEVYVRMDEIEAVRGLDRAFTVVFALVTGAALFGFCASTAGSALASVRRKSRSLGLMRLLGFPRAGILLFPVAQTVATGVFGSLMAYALYLAVAFSIDRLFAASLPGGESVCSLPPAYVVGIFAVVVILSAVSSLSAAWQADAIEPSEVIRDV